MEEFLVLGRADGGVLQKTLRSEVEGFRDEAGLTLDLPVK